MMKYSIIVNKILSKAFLMFSLSLFSLGLFAPNAVADGPYALSCPEGTAEFDLKVGELDYLVEAKLDCSQSAIPREDNLLLYFNVTDEGPECGLILFRFGGRITSQFIGHFWLEEPRSRVICVDTTAPDDWSFTTEERFDNGEEQLAIEIRITGSLY